MTQNRRTAAPDSPIDLLPLSEPIRRALSYAARTSPARGVLTTGRVLEALSTIDDSGHWARLWLHAGGSAGLADAPDPASPERRGLSGRWDGVPMSTALVAALQLLARIAQAYRMDPVPPGALALALVAEPSCGAATVLTSGGLPHRELLELVQSELLGTTLQELDTVLAAQRSSVHTGAVTAPSRPERDIDDEPGAIAVWPRRAAVFWWILKPAATVAALVAAIIYLASGGSVLAGVLGIVGTVFVRPVTRPWFSVIVPLALFWFSPAVAGILAVRALIGIIGIRLAADTWSAGLEVVRHSRRAMIEVGTLTEEWAALADRQHTDELAELHLDAWSVVAAAWCTADARILWDTTLEVVRSLINGKWRFDVGPGVSVHGFRLSTSSGLTYHGYALVGWGCAAAIVFLLDLKLPVHVFGLTIPGWIAPLLILVVPASIPAYVLERRAELRLIAGTRQATLPALRPCPGWLGARRTWRTARKALLRNEPDTAIPLFETLSRDPRRPAAIHAAAWGALAELALERGDLDNAAECADKSVAAMSTTAQVTTQVAASAGRVLFAIGDTQRAVGLLDVAMRDRRNRRNPMVAAAAYQAFTLHAGDTMAATLRTLPRTGWPLEILIEAESSVALLNTRLPIETREQGLSELVKFIEFDGQEIRDEFVLSRIRLARARAKLVIGRLQIDRGDDAAAVDSLRAAVDGLPGIANAIERAVARILLGTVLSRTEPRQALSELASGIRDLEERRGLLSSERYRSRLITRYGDVYSHAFSAITRIQRIDPAAGPLAGELAESLRRGALARALRGQNLELPADLRELHDRIAQLEADPLGDHAAELSACRVALREQLSAAFAAAYLPVSVDYRALRSRVRHTHVLTYHLETDRPERMAGHVIWTPPNSTPIVEHFDMRDTAALALLGAAGQPERDKVMRATQTQTELERWQTVGRALLPSMLRAQLLRINPADPASLLIVPDGRLAALPWAALRLDNGTPLAMAAVLQMTPTLDIIETAPATTRKAHIVLAHFGIHGGPSETRMRADTRRFTITATQAQFLSALTTSQFMGAYLAVHGDDEELDQRVRFGDATMLSAAKALTFPWPPWVVFASCLVGRIALHAGKEPLGLPISCLLGGGHTVIGGVTELLDGPMDRMGAMLAEQLHTGVHPAVATRAAQLNELSRRATPPRPIAWAGLICMSRIQPCPTHDYQ